MPSFGTTMPSFGTTMPSFGTSMPSFGLGSTLGGFSAPTTMGYGAPAMSYAPTTSYAPTMSYGGYGAARPVSYGGYGGYGGISTYGGYGGISSYGTSMPMTTMPMTGSYVAPSMPTMAAPMPMP